MYGFTQPFDNTGVTVELREIVESGVDIWAFDYPVPRASIDYNGKTCKVDFDKAAFEKKIVDHYYFRQIGQETVGRWLHYFRTRIREIMPYYVQLYEFDAKFRNIEDPLESYNLREEYERQHSNNGTFTGSSSSEASSETSGSNTRNATGSDKKDGENNSVRKFSNTPQGSVSNLDDHLTEATVENGDLSETITRSDNASESNTASVESSESGSANQTSTDNGEESYTLTKRGNIGVQPLGGEVENIRNAFINIDQQIINELKDLFLQVY